MNKAVKCLVVVGCAVMLCGCGNSENRIEQQQSLRTQGIAQAQSGDYDSAVQSFDQALKLSDMQVGSLELDIAAYKAAAEYHQGNLDQAIDTCSAILDVKKSAEIYLTRGLLYRDAENQEAANADFTEALNRTSKKDLIMKGRLYYYMKDYTNAKSCLEEAVKNGDQEGVYWQAELYWGESEVEALYKDVVAHDNVSANMAALTFQANINTMEVKGLEQLLSLSSPDVQRRFWNTMQAQSVLRSNFGVQLVEQGNKINNTQYTFTGLQEVYESMCLNLCGASHYPMTKLFGRSPAGMNATGESDLKNYYDYVDTLRESRLRPVLEKLLPVLARSAGIQLEDADLSFPPLWTPTAKETADIAKIKADSIVSAFQSGLLDVPAAQQELRRLSDETGMFGSITDEAIAANAGKTYQDVTAMRDPLAGLTENLTGMEVPTADTSVFDFNSRHDPSDGRFTSGGGSGKIEKTKYAPSPQRSESKIQLKPKTYARLTGVLNTQYPGLLAGEKVIIRDANYQYHVTADGFGGLSVERRIPITNRRKK